MHKHLRTYILKAFTFYSYAPPPQVYFYTHESSRDCGCCHNNVDSTGLLDILMALLMLLMGFMTMIINININNNNNNGKAAWI